MKQTLNTYEVAELLVNDANANWSRAGALALAKYLEQVEADTGEDIEIDVVTLRCEFTEYASLEDYHNECLSGSDAFVESEFREYIEANGTLIEFEGGVIVSNF